MINLKPLIVQKLKSIHSNVVESFPQDWVNFPIVCYEEELNVPHTHTTSGEEMSTIRYKIDIYSNSSTSQLKSSINAIFYELGFTRVGANDTNDISGRRHSILRFEGVIDLENNKIYKSN